MKILLKFDFTDYDLTVKIREESDVAVARRMAKQFSEKLGFSLADVTKIATAVSELSRNIYRYAGSGEIHMKKREVDGLPMVEIIAADRGPGIEDLKKAVREGYTTSQRSFGLGLAGVKRLMDSFEITSEKGKGTVVVVGKRRRRFFE